jgi:hypothetical protein
MNLHARTDKSDDTKDVIYEKLECIFDQFDFTGKWGEDILKSTVDNDSLMKLVMIMGLER